MRGLQAGTIFRKMLVVLADLVTKITTLGGTDVQLCYRPPCNFNIFPVHDLSPLVSLVLQYLLK
jgi:hypothetical protein